MDDATAEPVSVVLGTLISSLSSKELHPVFGTNFPRESGRWRELYEVLLAKISF